MGRVLTMFAAMTAGAGVASAQVHPLQPPPKPVPRGGTAVSARPPAPATTRKPSMTPQQRGAAAQQLTGKPGAQAGATVRYGLNVLNTPQIAFHKVESFTGKSEQLSMAGNGEVVLYFMEPGKTSASGIRLFECDVERYGSKSDGPWFKWRMRPAGPGDDVGLTVTVKGNKAVFAADLTNMQPIIILSGDPDGWQFRGCDVTKIT